MLPVDKQVLAKIRTLKSEFTQNADVQQVSLASESPVFVNGGYGVRRANTPDSPYKMVAGLQIDEDFLKAMNLHLVAGRDVTQTDVEQASVPDGDSLNYYHFVPNESAVKELGWTPQQAIGQKLDMNGRKGEIKAVVADFHFASMKQKIGPLILFPEMGGELLLVKLSGNPTARYTSVFWKPNGVHSSLTDHSPTNLWTKSSTNCMPPKPVPDEFSVSSLFCRSFWPVWVCSVYRLTPPPSAPKRLACAKYWGASVLSIVGLLSKRFPEAGLYRHRHCLPRRLVRHEPLAARFCLPD